MTKVTIILTTLMLCFIALQFYFIEPSEHTIAYLITLYVYLLFDNNKLFNIHSFEQPLTIINMPLKRINL